MFTIISGKTIICTNALMVEYRTTSGWFSQSVAVITDLGEFVFSFDKYAKKETDLYVNYVNRVYHIVKEALLSGNRDARIDIGEFLILFLTLLEKMLVLIKHLKRV